MYWKSKRSTQLLCIFAVIMLCVFSSCGKEAAKDEQKSIGQRRETGKAVYVAGGDSGVGRTVSEYVGAYLSEKGYEVFFEREAGVVFDGVIAVGEDGVLKALENEQEGAFVYCIWEEFEKWEALSQNIGIRASVSSKELAKASMALLPEADRFAVMSDTKGALDVQDACDEFDRCGVDYRVEALSFGQPYGDAIINAAKKGYSAVLLPYFELSAGGIDIGESEVETAIIAVGEGEPVKGALATFCVDAQALAHDTAELFVKVLSGEATDGIDGGYYMLCISESVEKYFETDREGVEMLFPVTVTE